VPEEAIDRARRIPGPSREVSSKTRPGWLSLSTKAGLSAETEDEVATAMGAMVHPEMVSRAADSSLRPFRSSR